MGWRLTPKELELLRRAPGHWAELPVGVRPSQAAFKRLLSLGLIDKGVYRPSGPLNIEDTWRRTFRLPSEMATEGIQNLRDQPAYSSPDKLAASAVLGVRGALRALSEKLPTRDRQALIRALAFLE